jgi:apolipoprotein N-acyltransferase
VARHAPGPPTAVGGTSEAIAWLAGWRGDALALLSGLALPLAYAPFHAFVVAPLSVAGLFAAWTGATPRRAAWRGWLFGLGAFGVGVSWVQVSIYRFGGVSLAESVLLTALLIAVLAGYLTLLGALAPRLGRAARAARLLLLYPGAWVVFEWLRGVLFTGFPWLDLGYSQVGSPLGGLAPVVGVYGVSLATALTGGALAYLLTAAPRRSLAALAAVGTLWGAGAALQPVSWTRPDGAPLEASLVQGNVIQGLKWLPGERQATLQLYARLTREHWSSRLIVWPETAVPMFYHQVAQDFLAPLAAEARAHGTDLLIGVPVLDEGSGRYYNALVSVGHDTAFYFKHHLVPFTEYLPLKDVLGTLVDVLDVPMSDFSAGPADQPPLQVAGTQVGASICYEVAFGSEIFRSLPAARLLVNVSNDAWFGDSLAPAQHLQIARMRALESGRPLLRATNTGITAFIDQHGRLSAVAPQFEPYVLTATVQPRAGLTPYVRFGDLPVLLLALSMVLAGWLPPRVREYAHFLWIAPWTSSG